jgi:hydroxymethylpyrimidine/phosphomethylpyrimidine kinase
VKIGMLGSPEVAHAVADCLESVNVPVVFDPVMVATSGAALADAETIAAFDRLARLATLITPNTPELEALAGMEVRTELEQSDAADIFMARTGCKALLAKGGHLELPGWTYGTDADGNAFQFDDATHVFDYLYLRSEEGYWSEGNWNSPRIATRHTHGTGCTLASAIATGLGAGLRLEAAINQAREFVRAALIAAPGFGEGHGPLGHQAVR